MLGRSYLNVGYITNVAGTNLNDLDHVTNSHISKIYCSWPLRPLADINDINS